MKIAINATCFSDRSSGATQRFKGIYRELFPRLNDAEFVVFEPPDCNIRSWFDARDNVTYKKALVSSQQPRAYRWLQGLRWPAILKREGCDIWDNFNMPLFRSPVGRTILLIHDIRHITVYGSSVRKYLSKMVMDRAMAQCDRLITVSESTRNEILARYPSLNVSVIYNCVDPALFQIASPADLQRVRDAHNLPADFVLAVGHFEPRKNYRNLITATSLLHDRGRDIPLVIAGNNNGELDLLRKHIDGLGVQANVTILCGLSDLEIACLYRLSKLFVFPSYYEGFGIPILEAMASGCPMVLSDIPIFREITEGRGVYFDHSKPESIASAIDHVLSSNCELDRLVRYGNRRVSDFSFPRAAQALESVYRELC
jgi:glycosyltransferase involved in cell wall biosynthesis